MAKYKIMSVILKVLYRFNSYCKATANRELVFGEALQGFVMLFYSMYTDMHFTNLPMD